MNSKNRNNTEHSKTGVDDAHQDGKEDYAAHLSRAREYADQSKALLQAHYKALHDNDPDESTTD